MPITEFLYRILPTGVFEKLRKTYNKSSRFWNAPISEDRVKQIVTQELGVKKGSTVFVHSATDKLNISFPFYRILPILLEIVGEEGTLLFPCWQFDYRAEDYLKKNEVFDVKRTPTVMGILPEFARRYRNAYRSLHPTASVVAIGKHAHELTKDHINSRSSTDEHSPFYKIMDYEGIIIGLGVSTYNLSFVHCVEDAMGDSFPVKVYMDGVFEGLVRDENGVIHTVKTHVHHEQIKFRKIVKYMKKNIAPIICKDIKIGGVKYFTANSRELFERMKSLASKGVTIYTDKAVHVRIQKAK